MKDKLLKPIEREGQLHTTRRRNRNWTPPKVEVVDGKDTIVQSKEPEFVWTAFTPGTTVEVSEATGRKWIDAGLAQAVEDVKAEPTPEPKAEETPKKEIANEPARKHRPQQPAQRDRPPANG